MTLNPAIIALLLSSLLICLMVLYASYFGVIILRRWDLKSGSELQLRLERRTYLISTILQYVFGFQVVSLFLLVYTAENLHTLFVGAMCAAGTLNVNHFGYPALGMKALNFLLASTWLVLNHADGRAQDYPLTRPKNSLLLAMAPLVAAEAVLLWAYVIGLRPDVITSCCGTLFGTGRVTVLSLPSYIPSIPMLYALLTTTVVTILVGVLCYIKRAGHRIYAVFSFLALGVSLTGLVSAVSPYVYELPTHRCPFCLLQPEYGYIGYLMYIPLFAGAASGLGAGALGFFRRVPSLKDALPPLMRRLVLFSVLMYFVFSAVSLYAVLSSGLVMAGY